MANTDSAIDSDPNVDITLHAEDGTKYGFVVVDGAGRQNFKAITRHSVPRTPFKMMSGDHEYADFEFPFVQIPQTDWSGGGGQETYENNRTRFRTSWGANTWMDGRVILGPREYFTTGHRNLSQDLPGDVAFEPLIETAAWNTRYMSKSFSPEADFTCAGASFWVHGHDGDGSTAPLPTLTARLTRDDGAGKPDWGNVIATATFARDAYIDTELEYTSMLLDMEWGSAVTIKSTSTYHVVLDGGAGTDPNGAYGQWKVGTKHGGTGTFISSTTTSWGTTGTGGSGTNLFSMYFRAWEAEAPFIGHLFEYRSAQYMIASYDDGSTPKLFRNGYRGVATGAQTSTTLKDTTQAWDTNELAGKTLYLEDGTGEGQWRIVVSNTSDTITVAAWDTTPVAGSTTYVIQGMDLWVELTGHGIANSIVDVAVSNNIVFVSQGSSVNLIAYRGWVDGGGAWEDLGETADTRFTLTGHKGDYFVLPLHPEHGEIVAVTEGNQTIKGAKFPGWGKIPSFHFETKIARSDTKIVGIELGGSDRSRMVVFKEDSMWVGSFGGFERLPIDGFDKVSSPLNGKGNMVVGPYVYYSFLGSVERLHLDSKNIDDLGPDKGTGLPKDRRGTIVDMLVYPGMIICAVDGGDDNYSSVMIYNHAGWHTLYKAHTVGKRIRKLSFQQIDGMSDRLWVSMGSDILWFPFPSNSFDPVNDDDYTYTHEAVIDTSYMSGGLQDLEKHFRELGIFAKDLSSGNLLVSPWDVREIHMVSRQDGETQWTASGAAQRTANSDGGIIEYKERVGSAVNGHVVKGYKNQNRIIIRSDQAAKTPVLTATVQKQATFVEEKNAWTMLVRVQDQNVDLQGDESAETAVEVLAALDAWAGSPEVLLFNSRFFAWGSQVKVYLSPINIQPHRLVRDDDIEGFIVQLELTQV